MGLTAALAMLGERLDGQAKPPAGGHGGLLASGHQVMLGRGDQPERRNRGVNQQPVHGPKPPTMSESGFPS